MCGWVYSPTRAGPYWAGGPAEPEVPRLAQADPWAAGADYRKCWHQRRPRPPPHPHYPPPLPPDADPHNSTSLQLWLQGRGKCERENKRYFFDLMEEAGPRHLKGRSGHHTSCIQGHFTPTRPPLLLFFA